MLATAIGVFVAPALDLVSAGGVRFFFGLSALLYIGHLFTLAAHYELYGLGHKRSMKWCPRQEVVALSSVFLVAALYVILALRGH